MRDPESPRSGSVPGVALGLMLAAGLLPGMGAADGLPVPDEIRLGYAVQKFDNTFQLAASFDLKPWRWIKSSRTELSLGPMLADGELSGFISIGPVWAASSLFGSRAFLELSISPTLLGRSHFDGTDMGGHFHFTSSLTLGYRFESINIGLRAQHISNAGLQNPNPGMDIVALAFSKRY